MDSQQKNPITEGSIYKQLLIFFFPILMGTFFQQLYNTVDAKRPLYYLITCTLLNVVLDLLFVVVFDMSVAGVAIATVLAQSMSAVLVMRRLCVADDIYRVTLKKYVSIWTT